MPIASDRALIIPTYMRPASMDRLKEKIVRNGASEKTLYPLLRYKGGRGVAWAHRWWNYAINMMESKCETFTDAGKLYRNPDFSHLLGVCSAKSLAGGIGGIRSWFSRLYDHSDVTDQIDGLTQYVKDIWDNTHYRPWSLTQVSEFTYDHKCHVPWRSFVKPPKHPRIYAPRKADVLVYPFVIHEPKNRGGEYEMMMAVNQAVSKTLPPGLRADVCQDLIMEILLGHITLDNLQEDPRRFVRQAMKTNQSHYGDLSLDGVIRDGDERDGHSRLPPQPVGMEW